MNKGDLLNLWMVFESLQKEKANVKFSYAIAKNRMNIKSEVEALKEASKPSDEFMAFDQERLSLAQEYADKDDSGKVIVDDGTFTITENMDKFKEKVDALREKHAVFIKIRDDQMKEFEVLLKDEFKFEPFQIDIENLPEVIEPEVIEVLMNCNLIKE